MCEKSFLYRSRRVSIAPLRMSRLGRCGRKSLPTKKHTKMKSSINRSRSHPPAHEKSHPRANSRSRYSRNVDTWSHWNGVCPVPAAACAASVPSCVESSSRESSASTCAEVQNVSMNQQKKHD